MTGMNFKNAVISVKWNSG